MKRLSETTLIDTEVPAFVTVSDYPRHATPKVVHLGVGAFHRAHLAAYFDKMNELIESPWLITGASLQQRRASQQLNPQQGLYTHWTRDRSGDQYRIVRALSGVLYAPDENQALIDLIAAPQTHLVTLTVTEKGYCLNTATGELDTSHPEIFADLKTPQQPKSAIGVLARGLQLRKARHGGPITILSCDNLPLNGQRCREAVRTFAGLYEASLQSWLDNNVAFPCSMVDRICPAISDDQLAQVHDLLGLEDQGAVITEAFSQWVVEDNFAGDRPPLELAGVTLVDSVQQWESRKLRLLNAAHSAMAYLGGLAGLATVNEAVSTPSLRTFVAGLWRETAATLAEEVPSEVSTYCDALLLRFANPNLNHQLTQIASDGSQKLPQRILAPLAERLASGQDVPHLTSIVAAWLHWQWGTTLDGQPVVSHEPMAQEFATLIGHRDRQNETAAQELAMAYPALANLITRFPDWQNVLIDSFNALPSSPLVSEPKP
ncbi:mannitol dehydrogenase family protein [Luminiphilus sp.]|nr:mannitol dehydrogenase family protein [Luminiphilus sp.]